MTARNPSGRLGFALAVALVLAACGGGGNSPVATSGAQPTEAAPTDDGSGGGGGGGSGADPSKGTLHAQVTGDITLTIDLAVSPPVTHFETSGDKSAYLVFANADGTQSFFLTLSPGPALIQWGNGTTLLINGAGDCTAQVDELDDSHAKGSFSCAGMMLTTETTTGTASMTGTFEASK